jgi:hypothetical protein
MRNNLPPIICILCSSQANQLATESSTRHILCDNCGEYIITFAAERLFKLNNFDDIKYLLSSQSYENMIDKKEPFVITAEQLSNPIELSLIEKLYKLSKYLWHKTKKHDVGNTNLDIIHSQTYCKDMNELAYLTNILRKKNVINGSISSVSYGTTTAYGCSIRLSPDAIIAFESGLNDIKTFKEVFMLSNNRNITIGVEDSTNTKIIVAIEGSKIEVVKNNDSMFVEIAELLEELKSQVPIDLPVVIKDQVSESISAIKTEINSPKPNKSLISTLLIGLKGLVNAAGFAASVATILQYISSV